MSNPPHLTQQQLDQHMQADGFSAETFQKTIPSEQLPMLPSHQEDDRPHILMLDDSNPFLEQIKEAWQLSPYQTAFRLHTLTLDKNIKRHEAVDQIKSLAIKTKGNLFVFVDRNQPSFKANDFFSELNKQQEIRYIPVAYMTAGEMSPDDIKEIISAGAQRILYNKRSNAYFLYECASTLDQLKDGAENNKWNDLRDELTKDIAEPSYDTHNNHTFSKTNAFLSAYLNVDKWLLRAMDCDGKLVSFKSLPEGFNIPEVLEPDAIPFISKLLTENEPLKIDSLTQDDLGKTHKATDKCRGYRLLAAPLRYGDECLGTLTLFRKPENKPFRDADIQTIAPVVAMLSLFIGQEQAQKRLQQRQQELLEFASDVDQCTDYKQILEKLLNRLHIDIQRSDNENSKTTSRLFIAATGKLQRLVSSYGVKPKIIDLNIYSKKSTHADAVMKGKTIRYGNNDEESDGHYSSTADGMMSCLTVPLLANGRLCLGSVNLENAQENFFNEADQTYAESLCRVAANALFRLRENGFKQGFIDLIDLLNQPNAEIFPTLYKLLYDYFGYARLLLIAPGSTLDSPWRVERVIIEGEDKSKQEVNQWQGHFKNNWSKSFIKKIIMNVEPYDSFTNDVAIDDSEMGIITKSQAVIRIHEKNKLEADHALVFFFLIKDALNAEQKQLLESFGHFFNTLIQHRKRDSGYYIQALNKEITQAANQQRHTLKDNIGALRILVDEFKDDEMDKMLFLEAIDKELTNSSSILASYHFLIKEQPEYTEVNLADLWKDASNLVCGEHDKSRITAETTSTDCLMTDKDLMKAVLANLIQNSVQAGASKVWMKTETKSNDLFIRVSDNGQGISEDAKLKLFLLGETTKSSGTGFGLHYCRGTLHKLGGEIYFNSDNKHTCFEIQLPIKKS